MSIGVIPQPAMQKYASMINEAADAKQAIIKTAEFDEKFKRAKEEVVYEKVEEQKSETIEFDPDEIETIVNRPNNFRESLAAEVDEKKAKENAENNKKSIEINLAKDE